MRLRRVLVLGSCGVAAILGFASVAWACGEVVNHASLGVSPSRGPANSTVRVAGSNWVAGDVVAISLGGQSLGNATADSVGRFNVAVRIPAVSTGTQAISASGGGRSAAFPFEVSPPPATETGTTSISTGEQDPGRPSGRIPSAEPVGDTTTVSPSSPATSTGDPVGQPTAGQSVIPGAPAPAAISSLPPGATGRAGTSTASARPVAKATTGSGGAEVTAPAEQASAVDTDATGVAVSPSSAQGDLWSGFTSGPAGATRARGLADLAGPGPSSGPSPLAVGAGLTVIGMLAMVVGFASAEVGRRRVLAHADRSTGR